MSNYYLNKKRLESFGKFCELVGIKASNLPKRSFNKIKTCLNLSFEKSLIYYMTNEYASLEIESHFVDLPMPNSNIALMNREEYFSENNMKQLITGCVLYSQNHILLLSNNICDAYKEITYAAVQGHVEEATSSSNNIPLDRLSGLLYSNTIRELCEECDNVSIDIIHRIEDAYTEPEENIIIAATNTFNGSDIKHIGFISVVEINDGDLLKIESAEPDKHRCMSIDLSDLYFKFDSLCPWVKTVISKHKELNAICKAATISASFNLNLS